jgi:hypothetical protein
MDEVCVAGNGVMSAEIAAAISANGQGTAQAAFSTLDPYKGSR